MPTLLTLAVLAALLSPPDGGGCVPPDGCGPHAVAPVSECHFVTGTGGGGGPCVEVAK